MSKVSFLSFNCGRREDLPGGVQVSDKGHGEGNAEKEVAKAFEVLDADGDGFIDFKEFMKVNDNGRGVKKSDIHNAFRVFDLDGNGKISAEELLEVLKKLGERCSLESCREMVRGVDKDGDGLNRYG
ncbi:hypothetical protein Acr_27g0004960 [Actinidia rufa]|uniref:EF-hand domain-containing protein n=1 Tax=Actinidia rufa TaxID=165716 RepID=A0A7J0H6N2_9ERIC|nr:hypothetical protein Acr_27g0004960 [Actinidia rufa]